MSISGTAFGKRDWTAEVSVYWPGSQRQQEVGEGRRGGEEIQRWHVDPPPLLQERERNAYRHIMFLLSSRPFQKGFLLFDVHIWLLLKAAVYSTGRKIQFCLHEVLTQIGWEDYFYSLCSLESWIRHFFTLEKAWILYREILHLSWRNGTLGLI